MTIDERLEFLLQTTESLHASTQQLHAAAARQSDQIAKNSEQIAALGTQIATLGRLIEIDAQNIRRLANIAEAHEHRLDGLERRHGDEGEA